MIVGWNLDEHDLVTLIVGYWVGLPIKAAEVLDHVFGFSNPVIAEGTIRKRALRAFLYMDGKFLHHISSSRAGREEFGTGEKLT